MSTATEKYGRSSYATKKASRFNAGESVKKIIESRRKKEEETIDCEIGEISPSKHDNGNFEQTSKSVTGNVSLRSNAVPMTDYEKYIFKRMKCVNDLHGSLRTNLDKFSNLVLECQGDHSKKDSFNLSHSKKDILKQINELNIQVLQKNFGRGGSESLLTGAAFSEKMKKFEASLYDQQNSMENSIKRKEDIFKYFAKETNSFSRITMKILNELINQNKSLKKRCAAMFRAVNQNGEAHNEINSMSQTFSTQQGFNQSQNNPLQTENQAVEIMKLKTRIKDLDIMLRSSKTSMSFRPDIFDQDILSNLKSTYDLKITTNSKKLSSIFSLMNDKLAIYDDRVNSFEKVLSEKIKYVRGWRNNKGSKLLDNLIDKLNSQIGNLEKKSSTLEYQNKSLETDLKVLTSKFESSEDIRIELNKRLESLIQENGELVKKVASINMASFNTPKHQITQELNFTPKSEKKVTFHEETVSKQSHDESKERIHELELEVAALKDEREKLEVRVDNLKIKVKSNSPNEEEKVKRSAFSKSKSIGDNKDHEIEKLEDEISKLQKDKEEGENNIDDLNLKVNEQVVKVEELEEKLRDETQSLQDEIDVCVETITDKEKEVLSIKEEMERLKSELEEKREEKQILKREIIKKESCLIKANCLVEDLKDELVVLREDPKAVEAPGKAPEGKVSIFSDKMKDLTAELEELRTTKATLLEENEKNGNEAKEYREKFERREEIYQHLKKLYAGVLEEKEGLEEDSKYLEDQKNNLTEEKKELLKRIEELREEVDTQKEKSRKIKEELVEKETKLIVSMMDMTDLKNENIEFKNKYNSQSMANLGEVLKFGKDELQSILKQIMESKNLKVIKVKVNELMEKLKENQGANRPSSPHMSIEGNQDDQYKISEDAEYENAQE